MSGGHFDYDQFKIGKIAMQIEHLIYHNDDEELDDYGYRKYQKYSPETVTKFKDTVSLMNLAQIYATRIDWLVSGDDSEESFYTRLKEDLDTFTNEVAQK